MTTSNPKLIIPPDIIIGGMIFSSSQTGHIACLSLQLAYESRVEPSVINAPNLVEFARLSALTKVAQRRLNTINAELRIAAAEIQGGITTQHQLKGLFAHGVAATVLMRKINESDYCHSRDTLHRLKNALTTGFEGVVGEAQLFEGRFANCPTDFEPGELKFFESEIERRICVQGEQKSRATVKFGSSR